MITGTIAVVFIIAMIAAANNGEWGSVAIGAVVVVVLLALGSAGRKTTKAYSNFVDYWADDRRREPEERFGKAEHSMFESETLKARYAPIERSEAYKAAIERRKANQ